MRAVGGHIVRILLVSPSGRQDPVFMSAETPQHNEAAFSHTGFAAMRMDDAASHN
jgi:hypothetical protein